MIEAVLFDLDETLLDRTTALRAFLSDQFNRYSGSLGLAGSAEWRDRFVALDQRGQVHKTLVYPAILAEFGGDAEMQHSLYADYCAGCPAFAVPFNGMIDTLAAIRASGLQIGIVTNGETEFQTRHIEALGLDHLADAIFISQREGLRKPDTALFHRAADRLGAAPDRCLFVGDNPVADILGAAAAGMKTAWFRGALAWPEDRPDNPGPAIDSLEDVLVLLDATNGSRQSRITSVVRS